MNRDEFEKAYAEKYLEGDYIVARDNRDGEGYTDHHIDLCWKVYVIQQLAFNTQITDRQIVNKFLRVDW